MATEATGDLRATEVTSWDDVLQAKKEHDASQAMEERGSGVDWSERAAIGFEDDINAQAEMLRNFGYDSVRVHNDRLVVTDADSVDRYVDPSIFSFSEAVGDFADVVPSEGPGIAAETWGGMTGAALGAGGGPPGSALGAMVVGGIAGAGWDIVKQKMAEAFGSPRKYDPQQSLRAGVWGMVGEGTGQALGAFGSSKLQDYYAKNAEKYLPGSQEEKVQLAAQYAEEAGIPTDLLPVESLTSDPTLLKLSNWGSTMDELHDVVQKGQDAFRADVERVVGKTKEEVARFGGGHAPDISELDIQGRATWVRNSWANAVQHHHNVLAKAEADMYKRTLAGLPQGKNTEVSMKLTLDAIDAEIARVGDVASRGAGRKLTALENMRDDVADWKTIGHYLEGKKEYGPLMFETKTMGQSSNRIYRAILDDFRESAIAVGAHESAMLYDQARAIHKWQADLQGDAIFKRWWSKQHKVAQPELNVRALMSSFSDAMNSKDPGLIKRWRQNVGAQRADATDTGYVPAEATGEGKYIWNIFQQMAYDIMITESRNAAGSLGGSAFRKKLLSMGEPTLIELFGKEATQHMRALSELLNIDSVQRTLKANPPKTAQALHSIESFRDKILTRPKAWFNALAADRKTRRAVSKVIMPSGSPGIVRGRDYYLQGNIPTYQQIADGMASRGISKLDFQHLWRASMQAAQRWGREEQDDLEDLAREKLTGFGGAQDATATDQTGMRSAMPRPYGTPPIPGVEQPDPGSIGPATPLQTVAAGLEGPALPEPFERPDTMPIAQYRNIVEGQVPERSVADKIWPGWDDIPVDSNLPPGKFDALKLEGTGKMDTVPDMIINSIIGTLNAPITIAEFSDDLQSLSRKGLQVAVKTITNFPSFEDLSEMIYDDATTAGGFINTVGNIAKGMTQGYMQAGNPMRPTNYERRQPSVEEAMSQSLFKTIGSVLLSPDRITNEGLLVGLDGLAAFGTVFKAGQAFNKGYRFALSPNFAKLNIPKKDQDALIKSGEQIREAIVMREGGDTVGYIKMQGEAYKNFAPAYIAAQKELRKYGPTYTQQAPFTPNEGERYVNRIAFLQKNVDSRGKYIEDADALENAVFNYNEEGHPMGLVEHIFEASRDRYGPNFTAEEHLLVANEIGRDLGITIPKGLKAIMNNDRYDLESKYVFMQLANYRDYDWYPKLWAAAVEDVGNPAHLPLWNGVWALLSPQNKAELNYADAFHMMTLPMLYFEQAGRAGVEATRNGLRGYLHQRNFRGRDVVTNFPQITDRLSREFPDLWKRVIPGGSAAAVKMPARGRPKSKYAEMSSDDSPLGLHEAVNVANWRLQHQIRGQAGDPVKIIDVKNPKPGEPKKVVRAYKLFRQKKNQPGKLFPLFIGSNKETPVGRWVGAEHISTKGFAERSGWHVGVKPDASHLMKADGTMADDRVWAQVLIPADQDWQSVASASKTEDIRGQIPEGGFYRFPRPAHQGGEWRIAGAIKVEKILTPKEVAKANETINAPVGARGLLAGNPKFLASGEGRRAGVVTVSRARGKQNIPSLVMKPSKKEQAEEVLKTKRFKSFKRHGLEVLTKKEIKREADAQKRNLGYEYEAVSNVEGDRAFLPKPSVRHTESGREVQGWAVKMTNEQIDKLADYIFLGRFEGDYKTTSFWGTNITKEVRGKVPRSPLEIIQKTPEKASVSFGGVIKPSRLFTDITADVQYAKLYDGVGKQFDPLQYRWAQWQTGDMARKFNQSGIQAQAVGWGFPKYTEPEATSAKNILMTLGKKWPEEIGSIPSLRLHAEEAIAMYKQVAQRHPDALTPALKSPKPAWDMGHDKESLGFYPQGSLNYARHAEDVLQDQPRVSMTSSQPGDIQRAGYFKGLQPKVGALAGIVIEGEETLVSGRALWDFHEELWATIQNKEGSTTQFAEHLGSIAGTRSAIIPHVSGSYIGIENDYANTVIGGGDWGTILQGLALADPQHQRAFVWYHPRILTPDEGDVLDALKADTSRLAGFNDVGLKQGVQVEKADGGAWTYDELKELHRIVVADPALGRGQTYPQRKSYFDSPMNFSQTPDLTGIIFRNVSQDLNDDQYLDKLWIGLEKYIDESGIMLGNNKLFTARGGYHEHDDTVGYTELWREALRRMGIKGRSDLYAEDVYNQFYKPVLDLRARHRISPAPGSSHFAQRFDADGTIKYLQGIFDRKPVQVAVPSGLATPAP